MVLGLLKEIDFSNVFIFFKCSNIGQKKTHKIKNSYNFIIFTDC